MARGPEQTDVTATQQIVGVATLVFFVLSVWEAAAGILSPLFLLLNVAVGVGVGFLAQKLVLGFATRLVGTIFGAGNIPPPPTYPRQDVLIAQGRYAEAAEFFRDHIRVDPEDLEARFRLAELLETHLAAYDEAERCYLEIRRVARDERAQGRATNGLIDLYRKAGRGDRLKVELARFAQRYRGTAAGEAAAKELRELKAGDTPSAG